MELSNFMNDDKIEFQKRQQFAFNDECATCLKVVNHQHVTK